MNYPITDAVIRFKNGDAEAFNEIFEKTNQSLYYIIYKLTGNAEDAEDALQDTYLQIYQNIDKLSAPEAFINWATRIACNAAYSGGRKKKEVLLGEDERDLELLEEINDDFLPANVVDNEAKRQIIMQIIDQLPLPQKTAVLLYYYQELKVPQIAEIMDCSEGTVKSRLNYARAAIRKAVVDEEKRSGKLYAIPFFLFAEEAKQLALPKETLSGLSAQLSSQMSANASVGTSSASAAKGSFLSRLSKLALPQKLGMGAAVLLGAGILTASLLSSGSPKNAPEPSPVPIDAAIAEESSEPEELFEVKDTTLKLPESARIFSSHKCDCCGESAGDNWIKVVEDKFYCLDCYKSYDRFSV